MGRKWVEQLMAAQDERDGELLCDPFMRLPSKKQYPEYYVVIRRPMTLTEIRNKLKQKHYTTFQDLRQDLELICTNAKRFNMRDSEIWLKARDLHALIKEGASRIYEEWLESASSSTAAPPTSAIETGPATRPHKITLRAPRPSDPTPSSSTPAKRVKVKISTSPETKHSSPAPSHTATPPTTTTTTTTSYVPSVHSAAVGLKPATPPVLRTTDTTSSHESPSTPSEPRRRGAPRGKRLKVMLRWAVQSLMALQDSDKRPYSELFMELPSREEYPDYYQFIREPICFGDMERKLERKEYINPYAWDKDMRLMLSNAKFYNEEGSQVWNDAQALERYLDKTVIPTLLAEGFTLDPNDHRQAAQPSNMPSQGPPTPTHTRSPAPSSPTAAAAKPSGASAPAKPPHPSSSASPQPGTPTAAPARAPSVPQPQPRESPSPSPSPSQPPPPPPPPPKSAPPVSLERVVLDMERKQWPAHPATFATPDVCYEPLPASACAASSSRLHLQMRSYTNQQRTADVRLVLASPATTHVLVVPRGTHTTEWRWHVPPRAPNATDLPAFRVRCNAQSLEGVWDEHVYATTWHVQPGLHRLDVVWTWPDVQSATPHDEHARIYVRVEGI